MKLVKALYPQVKKKKKKKKVFKINKKIQNLKNPIISRGVFFFCFIYGRSFVHFYIHLSDFYIITKNFMRLKHLFSYFLQEIFQFSVYKTIITKADILIVFLAIKISFNYMLS